MSSIKPFKWQIQLDEMVQNHNFRLLFLEFIKENFIKRISCKWWISVLKGEE